MFINGELSNLMMNLFGQPKNTGEFRLSFLHGGLTHTNPLYFTAHNHVHGQIIFPFDTNHPMYLNVVENSFSLMPENENKEDIVQLSVEFRSCLLNELDSKHQIGWFPIGFCYFSIEAVVEYFKIETTSNRTALIQFGTAKSVGNFEDMCLKVVFGCCLFPQDGYSRSTPAKIYFEAIHSSPPRLVQLLKLFH